MKNSIAHPAVHGAATVLLLLALAACTADTDPADPATTPAAGEPSQSSTPPASPTPSVATPPSMPDVADASGDRQSIPIEPGTYVMPRSAWSVADFKATFPEGWSVQYGHVFARDTGPGDEFGFYAVLVDEIYADACRGERGDVVTVGPGAQALVDALLEQPGPAQRGPFDTTLGGYPATRVDLRMPLRMMQRNCFIGPGTGMQIWYSEPTDKYFVLLPDGFASVYVVDVNGERQVFLAQVGDPRSAADRAELQAVLDSIRIEG